MIVSIDQIKPNPKNPRVIKDDKFLKLKKSIEDFPDMLNKRPLIAFTDKDNKYVVLGGNMRLKASKELGLKELPIILADDWTEEQKAEFLIKDNVGFGEWDWSVLTTEWNVENLSEWGLDVPNISETQKLSGLEYKPIYYEPENIPYIKLNDCIDFALYNKKIEFINSLELDQNIKQTLTTLAYRFIKIDFENIANYYTFNASENEQLAIERLRLVLTDNGINGFIEDDILKIYNGLFAND
jgi:hypothetical protein